MDKEFYRFGGLCAVIVGLLSILYALFYLVIARQAEVVGTLGSWVILAASGIFSSAAYVALYRRISGQGENGFALWALLLGEMSAFATLLHGGHQALLTHALHTADPATRAFIENLRMVPSEVDPAGLATFGTVGLVAAIFSWQILRTRALSRSLGYIGLFNACLLVVLYAATVANLEPLILLSGGLTALIVGPVWWIWTGIQLLRDTRQFSLMSPPYGMSEQDESMTHGTFAQVKRAHM
jgi:hypothetical protein